MIHLDLNDSEAATLASALAYYVSDLRMEVADTERQAMRDTLKGEEAVLTKLLARLKPAVARA